MQNSNKMLWEPSTRWMPGLCMHSLPNLVTVEQTGKNTAIKDLWLSGISNRFINAMSIPCSACNTSSFGKNSPLSVQRVYSQFLWKPAVVSKCSSLCWWVLTSLLWKYQWRSLAAGLTALSSCLGSDCCNCLHISQLKSVIHEQLKTGQGNKWINDDRFLPSSLNKSWPFKLPISLSAL